VADGVGGETAGEVASATVLTAMVPLDADEPGGDVLETLRRAAAAANGVLGQMVAQDPALDGMGTTLTALLWSGSTLGLVHIGDSRAYLLRDGTLEQITNDHTWVRMLVEEGRITPAEAEQHPHRSVLVKAMQGRDRVEVDLSARSARAGDRYLLCSDGLTDVVGDALLRAALAAGDPAEAAEALVELALRGGGPDNVTCVVADVVELPDEQAAAQAGHRAGRGELVGAALAARLADAGPWPG
jgi:PPM family protein phosphatase